MIVRTRTSASSHRNAPSTRLDQIPRGSPLRSASSMSESRNSTRSGVELRELTYPNDFTASGFASLSDGSYCEVAAPGSAAFLDVRLQRSAFGELNGAPAAAVVLATAGGGSGTFFDLHVIVRDGDGAPTIAAQRGRVTFGRTVGSARLGCRGDAVNAESIWTALVVATLLPLLFLNRAVAPPPRDRVVSSPNASLPVPQEHPMTSETPTLDDRVDAEYAPVFRELLARELDVSDVAGSVDVIRAAGAARRAQLPIPVLPPDVSIDDHTTPARDGAPSVVVRIYRPATAPGAAPAFYYIHGGGMNRRVCRHVGSILRRDRESSRRRRGFRRVPPRAGVPLPGAARGLLHRPALDLDRRRRARHRPHPARDRRRKRRRWTRGRSRPPRP